MLLLLVGCLLPFASPALVRVSGINDIQLGQYDFLISGTFAQASDSICIYSTTPTYNITLSQPGGAFSLMGNVVGDSLPYEVIFTGSGVPVSAISGVPITAQVGNSQYPDCLGVDNASFLVRVLAADFNLAAPDDYNATLELLIGAE